MKNEIDLCSVSKYKLKYDIPEEQIMTNDTNDGKITHLKHQYRMGLESPPIHHLNFQIFKNHK